MTVSVNFITLYVGGVPVQVVEGSQLHFIYAGLGATTQPPTAIPYVRPDPFPQYVHDEEIGDLLADAAVPATDPVVAALLNDSGSATSGALREAYQPRTNVVVAATGGDYTSLADVFAAYPTGNVEIFVKGDVTVPATLTLAGVRNVVLRGAGRGTSVLHCAQGFVAASDNSDEWQIRDLTVICTAATNTFDGIVSDYPRRWSVENNTISGFGGTSVWYRGGLQSRVENNNITARDSSNTNGHSGIRVDLSSGGIFATTIGTRSNYIQGGKQYGIFMADVSIGVFQNDIVEYCQVGMRFERCAGALISPYTEQITGNNIEYHDSILPLVGHVRAEPVVTWASYGSNNRRFTRVGRDYLSPGRAIIYGGATGANNPDTAPSIRWGLGSPEGVVTGVVSSVWHRTDGGAGTSVYVKESGTGNTGWRAQVASVLNVADYGAKGDGATDDTAAINAAINAAPNGSRVQLQAGKNYLTAGVVISNKTGVTIDGNGARLTLKATGARHGVQLTGTCTKVTVCDLRIIGNGVVADMHAGVYASNGATLTACAVRNCHIVNVTLGISVNFDSTGTLDGWLVEGNELVDVIGVDPGVGYGLHVATNQASNCGARLIGNRIVRSQRHAIYQAQGRGTQIIGNTIDGHRAGVAESVTRAAINVLRSQDVLVSGNTTTSGYDSALNIGADTGTLNGVLVTDNTFADPKDNVPVVVIGDSSPISATRNVTLIGNTIWSLGRTGRLILINSGIGIFVAPNTLRWDYPSTSGTAVELMGAGDAAGTATYNDLISLTDLDISMSGGGTANRAFRLTGVETSTARLSFLRNNIRGASTEFIGASNVSNPNITVSGQGISGLTFAAGIRLQPALLAPLGFIPNTAAPIATPTAGGYLFVESGALKYKGSAGTVTTVGPA